MEGSFEGRRTEKKVSRGERAAVVKHRDNLKVEGSFEGRAKSEGVLRGERVTVKKHEDNLRLEGKFEGKKTEAVAMRGERAQVSILENFFFLCTEAPGLSVASWQGLPASTNVFG
jgi:glutamate synthase domain-containing protein 2